ncbi:MAG: TIR domain-containing protein [Candidatus Hydrogenedentes bacterium]|nr:TIR domain-containing protein [Candidatus Hydrogenedentota bacterium]
MAKKHVFISFDYGHDSEHRDLLNALSSLPNSEVAFEEFNPEETVKKDITETREELARRLHQATHMLVIVGSCANKYHKDKDGIGARNWQWLEIQKSEEEGMGLVAVKIEPTNAWPNPLYGKRPTWAKSFTVDSILAAINSV